MSFAGDQDTVTRLSQLKRLLNGGTSIDFDAGSREGFAHSCENLVDDRPRILAAWIVTGDNGDIGNQRGVAQLGTLGSIAITPRTEDTNHAARCQPLEAGQASAQGIVRMGIVHKNIEWLTTLDLFQSTGNGAKGLDSQGDFFEGKSQMRAGGDRSQDIRDVMTPDQSCGTVASP